MSQFSAQISQFKQLLSKNLNYLRCSVVGLSYDNLEAKLKDRGLPVSKITLLAIEKNGKLPNSRTLLRLSFYYGVALADLISVDLQHQANLEEQKKKEKSILDEKWRAKLLSL